MLEKKNPGKNDFPITSSIRLPFEPKKESLELKNLLRQEIESLIPNNSRKLYASLTSPKIDYFDVENILFYNVGTGVFSSLELEELQFELHFRPEENVYTYNYQLFQDSSPLTEPNKTLCRFSARNVSFKIDHKPFYYWLLLHHGEWELEAPYTQGSELSLTIEIGVPSLLRNMVSIMKPLLDGIIAVLHYQPEVNPEVINRLKDKTSLEGHKLASLFEPKDYSLLGERQLISIFRKGVKWNPQDELCTQVKLCQTLSPQGYLNVTVMERR